MRPFHLPRPCLVLVTDRHQTQGRDLEEVVAPAVAAGVGLVQLREKDLPASQLLSLAERLRRVTAGKALLTVNDRLDVALACAADGVHLPEAGLPITRVREAVPPRFLVGRSVHSVEGARRAAAEGADYLVVGTIFVTASKPGLAAAGVSLIRQVKEAVAIPVYAIGGVRVENIHQVMAAGADGAAVISAIMAASHPGAAAAALWNAMRAHIGSGAPVA